jgi:hypothetical protein
LAAKQGEQDLSGLTVQLAKSLIQKEKKEQK